MGQIVYQPVSMPYSPVQQQPVQSKPVNQENKVEAPTVIIGGGAGNFGITLTDLAAHYLSIPIEHAVIEGTLFDNGILDKVLPYDVQYPTEVGTWLHDVENQMATGIHNMIPTITPEVASQLATGIAAGTVMSVVSAGSGIIGPFIGVPITRLLMVVRNLGRRISGKQALNVKFGPIPLGQSSAGGAIAGSLLMAAKGGVIGSSFGLPGIFAGIGIGLVAGIVSGGIGGFIGGLLYNLVSYPFRGKK